MACAKIVSPEDARRTFLKRSCMQDASVPPHVQSRIDAMFGKSTTPAQCVSAILASIATDGDSAVADWTQRIDGAHLSDGCEISPQQLIDAQKRIPAKLLAALRVAARRVHAYHKAQPISSWFTNKLGGTMGQAIRPIEKIGVYTPGGTAPLPSTVLMSAIPAIVAGCSQLVIVSPPLRGATIPVIADVTMAACAVVQGFASDNCVVRVFAVGGAQAIGAMAYGTATVPQVDKIVGPGNIFVSIAKKEVFGVVGIDGIYGPTEAIVVADDSANPQMVAADLLAQAEHDFMSVPILITPCDTLAKSVQAEIEVQLKHLERNNVARAAISNQGGIVLASSLDECLELTNEFATEHVSMAVRNPWSVLAKVNNAGGVFVGEGSCEVLGDYVAGPSHVMPTGGSARYSSPLSVVDFVKIISIVGLDAATVQQLSPHAELIARSEGLDAHANAASLRKNFQE